MCGLAAILKRKDVRCSAAVLDSMRDEVAYRGPDDRGSAFFARCGSAWTEVSPSRTTWEAALAHRRLSILDLSSAGHQPMSYQAKCWITYNGEVYNFIELRVELERLGHCFRSSSDTEVILAAYAEWGAACFERLRGMWGLVILDCVRNELVLCRDRLGIKPLYFREGSGVVAVASEIKQFRHLPGFTAFLNATAAAEFLQTGYEDSRRSFFGGIEPVPAGSWLTISLDTLKVSPAKRYWFPERVQVSVTSAQDAGRLFAEKFCESVRVHLRSDVPVGCALSGGLDSSAIAVLVNQLNNGQRDPLHTFTSTFPGNVCDELEYVNAVLAQINAAPHFVTPDPLAFLEDLDRFLWIQDEPMGSFSIYAGYCVARLTRHHGVPVSLNGQGGDEVFSGYWQTYFFHLRDLWRKGRLSSLAGHFVGSMTGFGNPALVGQVPVMLRRYRARTTHQLQVRLGNLQKRRNGDVLKGVLALDEQTRRLYEIRDRSLPRLLRWDDRNLMAFSVEGRYPFLDHELIELCLSFAPQTLYKMGWTKHPLRLGLRNALPKKILRRRSKFGFETPQNTWLSGALRPELERWVRSDRPVWEFVDRGDVRRLMEQTTWSNKNVEAGQTLYRIFVFDRWLQIFDVKQAA